MGRMGHTMRGFAAVLGAVMAARVMASCGAGSNAAGLFSPDAGTAADAAGGTPAVVSCQTIADCPSDQICRRNFSTDFLGHCETPTGSCDGPADTADLTGRCYPGSRCDLSGLGSGSTGLCVFSPASRAAFPTAGTISLDSPTERTALTAMDGFTLQWGALPANASGATTVAVIMTALPVRDPATNQLRNWTHVRWIWSSADPGGAVQEGAVPLRFGARGLNPAGGLSATRWQQDTMDEGTYWWFVYAIDRGSVVASSAVQRFRVGPDRNPQRSCNTEEECVEAGDFPETAACIQARCMRRCASDLDCPAVGSRCDFTVTVTGQNRHSGFCSGILPATDGGTPDAAPVPDDASAPDDTSPVPDVGPVPDDAGPASDAGPPPDAPT